MRIAVETGAGQRLPLNRHPLVQAPHLALTIGQRSRCPARKTPVHPFDATAQQFGDAEALGDRAGDELVGRRDDQQAIAALAMPAQQRIGRRQQQRMDAFAHKLGAQRRQALRRAPRQRPQGKRGVGRDVQFAALVVLKKPLVAGAKDRAVDHAASAQKLTPKVIAVTGDKRVVEIENGQGHGWEPMRRSDGRGAQA